MALVAGNILRVACTQKFQVVNDNVNVFHFAVVTAPSPNTDAAALEDLSELIGDAFFTYGTHISDENSADNITVFNVTQDVPVGITSWGGSFVGGRSGGEMLPPQAACLVLLSTTVKRRQGRVYLGGCLEGDQSNGHWGGSILTAAATLIADLNSQPVLPNGGEFDLVVYSREHTASSGISTVRVQPLVATQKRRKAGVGS